MEEVNADREEHGKKPFEDEDNNNEPPKSSKPNKNTSKKKSARRKKMKTVTQSVTDPDSGLFVKATPHNSDCANLPSDFSSNKPN